MNARIDRAFVLCAAFALAVASCRDHAPTIDEAQIARTHQGLLGPGDTEIAADPCPETPGGQSGCARLVSARRISWFGYLGKWMRVMRLFGVPVQNGNQATDMESDAFDLGVTHPDRGLLSTFRNGDRLSHYANLRTQLGEPYAEIADEDEAAPLFLAGHDLRVTAGAVKQACQVSTIVSHELAQFLMNNEIPAANLPLVQRMFDVGNAGAQITGFKPQFGLLAFGRRFTDEEITLLNDGLEGGASRANEYQTFKTTLSAIMCSSPAMVE